MPELPEVETIRRYLQKHLIGKKIVGIDIREPKQFQGDAKKALTKQIDYIGRTGKILHMTLRDNKQPLHLSIHLKLSGQILFSPHKDKSVFENIIPRANSTRMPGATTRIILYFDDDSALYFNDMRKFGWVKLSQEPQQPQGADILSPLFTYDYFSKALKDVQRPIKTVLLDQEKMAGIGNIYANDSLWKARIHPARKTNSLNTEEIKSLYDAVIETIGEGIKYRGSSAKDELYVMPDSKKGEYQNHFKTYHQHGMPCKRCGETIQRMVIGGRGTFFCPTCQV